LNEETHLPETLPESRELAKRDWRERKAIKPSRRQERQDGKVKSGVWGMIELESGA
jgi:hypothetical protein